MSHCYRYCHHRRFGYSLAFLDVIMAGKLKLRHIACERSHSEKLTIDHMRWTSAAIFRRKIRILSNAGIMSCSSRAKVKWRKILNKYARI